MSRQSPFEHPTKRHQVCSSKLLVFPHLPLSNYHTTLQQLLRAWAKYWSPGTPKQNTKACMNTSLPACKQLQASFFLAIFPELPENEYSMKSVTVFSKVWIKGNDIQPLKMLLLYSFWVYMPANKIKHDRNNYSSILSYFSLQIMLRLLYVICWKQNSD